MSAAPLERLGLVYTPEAFTESPLRQERAGNSGPTGQEVTNVRFLEAYLRHGALALVPVVGHKSSVAALEKLTQGKQLAIIPAPQFHRHFFPQPAARVLHSPGPPSSAHLWARATHGPHSFTISGTVPGLGTPAQLHDWLTLAGAPWQPYDTLFCPSEAMRAALRAWLTSARGTLGMTSAGPRIEVVSGGVNPERFRPAHSEQKAAARQSLGLAAEETVVLSVGRLSVHAGANPYPLFHALYHAARQTHARVRLLLVGWAATETMRKVVEDGARVFAPTIGLTIRPGEPAELIEAYAAADLFVDFSDSLTQGQGRTVLEAMACGLPVVATDWGGHRDRVIPGQTGDLVPTRWPVGGSGTEVTRGLLGELGEDAFLGQTSQQLVVDLEASVRALVPLLDQPQRRRELGAAGRVRVEQHFTWPRLIATHDRIWQEQEAVRAECAAKAGPPVGLGLPGVSALFAGHATETVPESRRVRALVDRQTLLHRLSKVAMTSFAADSRCVDPATLMAVLEAASDPVPPAELRGVLTRANVTGPMVEATLAWLLKYGLLTLVEADA